MGNVAPASTETMNIAAGLLEIREGEEVEGDYQGESDIEPLVNDNLSHANDNVRVDDHSDVGNQNNMEVEALDHAHGNGVREDNGNNMETAGDLPMMAEVLGLGEVNGQHVNMENDAFEERQGHVHLQQPADNNKEAGGANKMPWIVQLYKVRPTLEYL